MQPTITSAHPLISSQNRSKAQLIDNQPAPLIHQLSSRSLSKPSTSRPASGNSVNRVESTGKKRPVKLDAVRSSTPPGPNLKGYGNAVIPPINPTPAKPKTAARSKKDVRATAANEEEDDTMGYIPPSASSKGGLRRASSLPSVNVFIGDFMKPRESIHKSSINLNSKQPKASQQHGSAFLNTTNHNSSGKGPKSKEVLNKNTFAASLSQMKPSDRSKSNCALLGKSNAKLTAPTASLQRGSTRQGSRMGLNSSIETPEARAVRIKAMELTPEKKEKAKKRWGALFKGLLKMMWATRMFASVLNRGEAEMEARQRGTSVDVAIKIRSILAKAKGARTESDFSHLSQLISSISPTFSSFTPGTKLRILDSLYYEFHPTTTIISRENDTSDSVYILISGEVEVSHGKVGRVPGMYKRKIVDVAKAGAILGAVDPREIVDGKGLRRDVNMVTMTDCDFVRLKIDDHIRALFTHDGSTLTNAVSLLNAHPLFSNEPENILTAAASAATLHRIPPHGTVIQEGETLDTIYFICEGFCTVSKHAKFVRKTFYDKGKKLKTNSDEGAFTSQWIPWTPGVPIKSHDLLIHQDLEYLDLKCGDALPDLPLLPNLPDPSLATGNTLDRPYMDPLLLTNSTPDLQLKTLKPRICYSTVKAKATGATLVSIPLSEFYKFANQRMVCTLFKNGARFRVPYAILQEAFLTSMESEAGDFRKVLDGLLGKRWKEGEREVVMRDVRREWEEEVAGYEKYDGEEDGGTLLPAMPTPTVLEPAVPKGGLEEYKMYFKYGNLS
ncbi:hypothetical protein HDV05_000431 [Chytridiales sp. JEL 0842]|nr:hypothetical protein HDV05_000431 [Chytridiales sp. JEL 0842]